MTSAHTPKRSRRSLRAVLTVLPLLVALLSQANPASAYTDDYPWKSDTTQSNDAYGFQKRQCVSYAAWRLYRAGHRISNSGQHWGGASHWDDAARALGKRITTTPKVGAIAQWNAYEKSTWYTSGGVGTIQAGSSGHVAWVAYVYSDKSVLVRQYNMNGNRSFAQMRVKAPRYIYVY
ncbi:MAG TPA: CHAP domain-containing protein [Mycobacteriales bacterium]|nr:CHAP domain-containing protein [Mycobacteriales bacterium]